MCQIFSFGHISAWIKARDVFLGPLNSPKCQLIDETLNMKNMQLVGKLWPKMWISCFSRPSIG
jgi:hypothetical protein